MKNGDCCQSYLCKDDCYHEGSVVFKVKKNELITTVVWLTCYRVQLRPSVLKSFLSSNSIQCVKESSSVKAESH